VVHTFAAPDAVNNNVDQSIWYLLYRDAYSKIGACGRSPVNRRKSQIVTFSGLTNLLRSARKWAFLTLRKKSICYNGVTDRANDRQRCFVSVNHRSLQSIIGLVSASSLTDLVTHCPGQLASTRGKPNS
jgi:hypothetical protein